MSEQTHQKYPPSVQHGIPRLSPAQHGWKSVAIGKLVTEVVRPVEMDDDETYTLVTAKRSRGGIVKREELKGREIAVKKQFYIQKGDFVISKRQIVHGACGFVPKELEGSIVSNEYLVLNFTDKIIPRFWDFLTHTIYFQQVCFHSSIGVHVEKMLFNVSRWYQWKVNIPTLKEQEKIASFLGSVDTRLTQLRRKHELLRTYKRGVMQKLFSQQIRFKGDQEKPFPDWEERELKSIAIVNPSSNHLPDKFFYIDLERVTDGRLSEPEHIDKDNAPSRAQRVLQQGDILYQTVRPYQRNNLFFDLQGSYVASTGYAQLRSKGDKRFLYYLVYSDGFVDEVISRCTGTSYPAINSSDLAGISVLIPESTEEQKKIADFLTAIDQKIKALSKQIELTEQFKRGLLQKMFV